MSERVQICLNCEGEGYIMNRGQQIATGILTLGMWPLMDAAMSRGARESDFSRKCKVCNGHGVVRAEAAGVPVRRVGGDR